MEATPVIQLFILAIELVEYRFWVCGVRAKSFAIFKYFVSRPQCEVVRQNWTAC